MFFFHIAFDAVVDPGIRARLHAIPTTFTLDAGELDAIEQGVARIFGDPASEARPCVRRLVEILARPATTPVVVDRNTWCGGGTDPEQRTREQMQKRR